MSRLLRVFGTPIRLWRGSLPVRVVASTLVASILVLGLGGWLLLQQVTAGVLDTKQRTALAEASVAYESAQRQLTAANASGTNVNEMLTQLAFEVANRGSVTDQYQVVVQGPVSDIRSGSIEAESVPESLRRTVSEADNLWITPTLVQYTDGSSEPGYAVGGSLLAPGAGRYQIYFIFPLTDEVRTLEVMQRAALTTGAVMVIALTLVSTMVARQVVLPVRRARLAAERLASGELGARMEVHGTDDLASLGTSMNRMATELQGQITQLEDLSRVQQRFVSDVSHELRTPLTTVRMASEMLYDSRDEFPPLMARSAELLHDEVERFQSLLDDLLEISRFDAGAAVLVAEPIDLADLTQTEIDALSGLADR
ncbi:MAG: HAMP domain-containing protein, partial [Propionibacterium sp.]|nr:HAMP domain-containing protein [Propionibacterium sp.]